MLVGVKGISEYKVCQITQNNISLFFPAFVSVPFVFGKNHKLKGSRWGISQPSRAIGETDVKDMRKVIPVVLYWFTCHDTSLVSCQIGAEHVQLSTAECYRFHV